MTGSERQELAQFGERMASVETQLETIKEQNTKREKLLEETQKDVKTIKEALAQGRGFRLGLLAALPIGGGGIGAVITNWLKSGGPTH